MGVSLCELLSLSLVDVRIRLIVYLLGGDQVVDKLEQKALLQILIKTEEIHALSTSKAQRMLKEAWDWSVQ